MGADASRACAPARRRDRGSKGKRGRAEGDHPACTSGLQCGNGLHDFRAEGRGDRRGRSRIFRDFTLACARAEPLAREQNRGVCAAAKRSPAGGRKTGLKRHPQEGQRSAASWRDPGPSASGERHVSLPRRIDAIGRDASSGAVHESLVRQRGRAHEHNSRISHNFLTPPRGLPCQPRAQRSAARRPAMAAATPLLHPKARASRRHALLRS
jgi:hypothetical protein